MKIKSKEATAIINSLGAGVVPRLGVQHIAVGRQAEVEAFTATLDEVKNGHSTVRFWIGDFGSGKSFMLHLLNTVALKQKFVVTNADFTPDNRLYANDGKARLLYTAIMDNIAIQSKPDGAALPSILSRWIEQAMTHAAHKAGLSLAEIASEEHQHLVREVIKADVEAVTESGGFDFATVVMHFFEGYIKEDEMQKRHAIKWLKGEYRTKTEARQDFGVREIVNDQNYYDMLKNFCRLFVRMGYSGFMVNLDEAINLYKISTSTMREKNYEKILSIFNDCLQGRIEHLFINFAGTLPFLENERRGLFSYDALKSRLQTNRFEQEGLVDYHQPVIKLRTLAHEEIFILLKRLKEIFDFNFGIESPVEHEDIRTFMEEIYNKPGASEFLLPREVIRDFVNILNLLRQNPGVPISRFIGELEIQDERPADDEDISIF